MTTEMPAHIFRPTDATMRQMDRAAIGSHYIWPEPRTNREAQHMANDIGRRDIKVISADHLLLILRPPLVRSLVLDEACYDRLHRGTLNRIQAFRRAMEDAKVATAIT